MSKNNITQLIVGPIATNCWIYHFGKNEAAIIDPGDEAEKIASTLKRLSLVPTFILLTHGHFDHIAAVPLLAKTFDLKIAIHRLDSDYLGPNAYKTQSQSVKAALGDTSFIDASWNNFPPADILLEDGDKVGPFTVLHLPGHSPGSAAFWDKEEKVLFSGDTLFKGTWGRTDLPGGSEEQIYASLRRLLAMDASLNVYPGHDRVTTIAREAGLLG